LRTNFLYPPSPLLARVSCNIRLKQKRTKYLHLKQIFGSVICFKKFQIFAILQTKNLQANVKRIWSAYDMNMKWSETNRSKYQKRSWTCFSEAKLSEYKQIKGSEKNRKNWIYFCIIQRKNRISGKYGHIRRIFALNQIKNRSEMGTP